MDYVQITVKPTANLKTLQIHGSNTEVKGCLSPFVKAPICPVLVTVTLRDKMVRKKRGLFIFFEHVAYCYRQKFLFKEY